VCRIQKHRRNTVATADDTNSYSQTPRQHPWQITCRLKNNLSPDFKVKTQVLQNLPHFENLDTLFGMRIRSTEHNPWKSCSNKAFVEQPFTLYSHIYVNCVICGYFSKVLRKQLEKLCRIIAPPIFTGNTQPIFAA
jgi:hypothetical protein